MKKKPLLLIMALSFFTSALFSFLNVRHEDPGAYGPAGLFFFAGLILTFTAFAPHAKRPRLFHVSEESGIQEFRPRPSEKNGDCVWAVDHAHLCNYLLPRDCPRVTYLHEGQRVIVVEEDWRARIAGTRLHVYEFPPGRFERVDATAG